MWCDWGSLINGTKVLNATYGENWFGVVDINANPKPSYFAYQTVATTIGMGTYFGTPAISGGGANAQNIHAYLFKQPNGIYDLFLWNSNNAVFDTTLYLPTQFNTIIINTTGGIEYNYSVANQINLNITPNLQIILLTPASDNVTALKSSDFQITAQYDPASVTAMIIIPLLSIGVIGVSIQEKKKEMK
jgi:hypothetical protein